MPQPLSTFGTKNYAILPRAPLLYPNLAAKVAVVLGLWAELDARIGMVFSRMLGVESQKGMEIYNALSSAGSHNIDAIFNAVSAVAFGNEARDILAGVRSFSGSVRDQRNALAHGIWGFSPDIPNALLLVNPKEHLRYNDSLIRVMVPFIEKLKAEAAAKNEPLAIAGKTFPTVEADLSKIFVYRENDFDAIIDRMVTATKLWSDFELYAIVQSSHGAEEARLRLLAEPIVLLRVNKLRETRQEPPITLP